MTTSSAYPSGAPQHSATPAMRQYLEVKRQHRDAIVFFRMGDFYEMFYEDALVGARALDLTLTSRAKDSAGAAIPMCGVPFHAVDTYLARLVRQGYRVAICDQIEDPRQAKGLVRRSVTRVVSPGTFTDAGYLEAREPAFLAAVAPPVGSSTVWGLACVDVSTGAFFATEVSGADSRVSLAAELALLQPRELLVAAPPEGAADPPVPVDRTRTRVTAVDGWTFEPARAQATLSEHLGVTSLTGFGLDGAPAAVAAAGAIVAYLRQTQPGEISHVRDITLVVASDALRIDPVTLRHLNIVEGVGGGRAGSLLDTVDRTLTPMGGRMLRGWLLRPLVTLARIQDRLDAVEDFAFRGAERGRFREALKPMHDLERLMARVSLGTAGPRDLVALRQSLTLIPRLTALVSELQAPLIRSLVAEIDDLTDVRGWLDDALVDDPRAVVREGGVIRDGYDTELDELRTVSQGGKAAIAALEEAERSRTGIASLKVRYNRVFGYYIEVSKSNLDRVPADYHRKQTVAGGERFITPALKDYEDKVLHADERLVAREIELFGELVKRLAAQAPRVLDTARAVASLDVLAALADTASAANYTKPHVHDGDEILASETRHPIVEQALGGGFVPNDIELGASDRQLIILTGPNMGGKSTYLRQTAILVILAQAGSFVPARSAKIGLVDRIFARVGASDDIARGQSTFMVEMQETASILHTATARSLVILDEIGRGTATFDGLSLAWAVAEHVATNDRARPKTIFATHYHELTDLADALPGIVNCHVAAREFRDTIVFLHKIIPGRSDRSYGIQVARLAGLPASVIRRATDILQALETDELTRGGRPSLSGGPASPEGQLALFQPTAVPPVVDRLRALEVDRLTPLEALNLLADLKREASE